MIVIDASAAIEMLLGRDPAVELRDAVAGEVAAPHLLDVEVASVLRGLDLGSRFPTGTLNEAKLSYGSFVIRRYEFVLLADRVWALRHSFTSYDACYLALAEALDAELFTCDRKLAAGNHGARVRVLPRTA
ncbi:type II toxin-antitoxin system VapC family toxin [Gryllotalpicola protaetiae]|uniref:Ribonuclease VapC n=1 Tax=Gryllotalpicola protaetiae TaxID=2419771 RepID=A0A387BP32_9MICO|nr:type II toxin-antitoxin system VapC family toxin [Gryllotalpicola protaetiae]AYG02889.1 PIN domain-containing protein [Gryllotalpicola protaetiae]